MALGKSLGNILGDYFGEETEITTQQNNNTNRTYIEEVEVHLIRRANHQTRQIFDPETIAQLAKSIEENGLIHPVMLLKDDDGYVLLSGERRLKAYQVLKKRTIPAIVREPDSLTEQQQAMLTAIENLQREDLSPLELAKTFDMLVRVSKSTGSKIALQLGYSSQYINNYLRLLTGSPDLQEALLTKKISEGQARHLLQLSFELQDKLLPIIITRQLTVLQCEKLARQNLENKTRNIVAYTNVPEFISPQVERLCRGLPNAKVKYKGDDKVGRLIIEWKN